MSPPRKRRLVAGYRLPVVVHERMGVTTSHGRVAVARSILCGACWGDRPRMVLPLRRGEAERPKRVFPTSPTGDMSLAPLPLWACGGGGVRRDPVGRR